MNILSYLKSLFSNNRPLHIPEDYTEFFHWVKKRTEAFWSGATDKPCPEDMLGAKWIGMTAAQINATEAKYGIQFMPEHRAFLRILHTIDRKEEVEYEDENGQLKTYQKSYFYNWLEDHEEIAYRLNWPYETIFQDVKDKGMWLKSWGPKPASVEEKEKIFAAWYARAPKLLPLTSHRFLVSQADLVDRPVLSVYGSDTIVYGWDLRLYLLKEIGGDMGLTKLTYFEMFQANISVPVEEVEALFDRVYEQAPQKDIPYWKEMMLQWSSGWSSFGLEAPGYTDEGPQPIMPTYVPEGEEPTQKTFNTYE